MTEGWTPQPPSDEELASERQEIESIPEDAPFEPPQETDPEDPITDIDRRNAMDRFMPDEEEGGDDEGGQGQSEQQTQETEAKPENKEQQTQEDNRKRPEWWDKAPDEAKEAYDRQQAAIANMRRQAKQAEQRLAIATDPERIKQAVQEAVKASQPEETPPDKDEDPDAYTAYLERKVQTIEQQGQQTQEKQQTEAEAQQLEQFVQSAENDFREEVPDYDEVLNQGVSIYRDRLMEEYGLDEQKAQATVVNELWQEVKKVRDIGGNPAQRLYRIAKQALDQKGTSVDNGNGSETTSAPQQAKAGGEQKAQAIEAGQKASTAVGKGSPGNVGEMSSQDLWNIRDPDEFAKAYDKVLASQLKQNTDWRP